MDTRGDLVPIPTCSRCFSSGTTAKRRSKIAAFAERHRVEHSCVLPSHAMTGSALRGRRPSSPLALPFAAVALVAGLVRALYLVQLRGSLPVQVLIGDARAYDAWAWRIASGDWLGDEVFYQAPLYPYFLGAIYRFAGH